MFWPWVFWPLGLRLILVIVAGDNWERQGVKMAVFIFDTGSYVSDDLSPTFPIRWIRKFTYKVGRLFMPVRPVGIRGGGS